MLMLASRRALSGLLCASILVLGACTSQESTDQEGDGAGGEPFVIGLATAQTGVIAPFDVPAVEGFRIGIDEINSAGGLDGEHPVELKVCDGRSDAA